MLSSRWPRSPSHDKCSKRFCGSSRNCGRSHHQRQHEMFDSHAFKSNRRNECVRMPRKTARSGSQIPLGRSGMSEPSTLSHLGFQPVQKTPTIHVSSGFIWGIRTQHTETGRDVSILAKFTWEKRGWCYDCFITCCVVSLDYLRNPISRRGACVALFLQLPALCGRQTCQHRFGGS